ncbi:unnamed protein product [Bursaphelenchus okinawaensis]|uniref:I/LWEQ domain-containing protein n=1 Tax=Bursaphelenchus okinawaensis TaxID=465554 RepID=A0A811KHQ6_9BILA|nr:unnamed protein product [Bursaphelenchus okinawaensis]CAG9103485.1 unnamed protein product [Bursaphelenchus okinawaensis]
MSRSALVADDRETFIKSQIIAVQKVLNKAEAPLKQKHVRSLIVGTHKERSASLFWSTVSRIPLEKSPVITWKFCNLLHKLIRDGHRKVVDDCARHISRLVQLGNFWQHLRASGYGNADAVYCRLLTKRLQFHQKYPQIPGSLQLTEQQINTISGDMNMSFELGIDLLDQIDELLAFRSAVTTLVDGYRWTSMVPQCQCLLAPLILVVLDSSLFYDLLVKIIFKLHSELPEDVLTGHRQRFMTTFKKLKEFYEGASNLQYFRYLVSVPSLPPNPPNFLQSSDLDTYRTPHAYLRDENGSDGTETPPDAQSVQDDTNMIIDLDLPETSSSVQSTFGVSPTRELEQQQMMEKMAELRRALESEMKAKDDIVMEARSRIEQYEARLVEMKEESDMYKDQSEQLNMQLQQLKDTANATEQQAEIQRQSEEKATEFEKKYTKLKSAYETFRGEHITALTELRDLRKFKTETSTEIAELKAELENERRKTEEGVQKSSDTVSELNSSLDKLKLDIENEKKASVNSQLHSLAESARGMLSHCKEELQNSSTISYPPHLAESELKVAQNSLQELFDSAKGGECDERFRREAISFLHYVCNAMVPCAAAAYTSSIEHYEPVLNACKEVIQEVSNVYIGLNGSKVPQLATSQLPKVIDLLNSLQDQVTALPTSNGDIDLEVVESQLQEEMERMNNAIKQAAERMKELQQQSKTKNSGIRLAVNDKILDHCNQLMAAVYELVEKSRDLQQEIVDAGRGTASPNEFYKRNHQWTKGLLSAAQGVGVSALELMNSADKVVLNEGKLQYLIVAAQEISASVAQLFVSSRVKADRESGKLAKLGKASKHVNECTGAVLAAVKDGKQTLEEEQLFDFSNYSLHEAKKAEMECQVRALELESLLSKERTKLASLRKQHYHMASLVDNENNA